MVHCAFARKLEFIPAHKSGYLQLNLGNRIIDIGWIANRNEKSKKSLIGEFATIAVCKIHP